MKYSHLKSLPIKKFSHERFDGGINTYKPEDLISSNQMSDGANLLFENGLLSTRKGLSFNLNEAIGNFDIGGFYHKGLKVTDTELLKGDTVYRVAYALFGDNTSYQILSVYLVSPDAKLTPVGEFNIRRTSFDTYYKFENIIFLVGSKKSGCGLYAFLNRKSGTNSIFEIYELSDTYSEWLRLYEEDFYIPVVQLNGKGNRYSEAVAEGGFSIPHITKPENYNLLTARFKAYFTTDGHSTRFQLPVKKLSSDSTVLCRLYISQSYYSEWIIPSGEDTATAMTDNGNITMRCYRNSGEIVFFDESGNYFSLPRSYIIGNNNLFVEATSFNESSISDIVGCKKCQIYNSNVFFYGNQKNPSNIYATSRENPLYFPENMKTSVGNPSDIVTAMAVQNNKLIAFKNSEIYYVSIKKEESELLTDTLVGSEKMVFENNNINLSLVHGSIGCIGKNTVAVCGNRLVWLSNDAKIYTLATTTYGKENNVYCVSSPVENLLRAYSQKELSEAFAIDAEGFYMLYIAQSLYMLDYRIKNFGISPVYTAVEDRTDSIAWYVMKLPYQKYYSGYVNRNKIYLACGDITGKYCVLASLSADTDKVLILENAVASEREIAIESSITTKFFCFGAPNLRKNIEEVYINMDFIGQADIILNDGVIEHRQTVFSSRKNISPIRIAPHFKGIYGLGITISSKNAISIRGISIKYKNLI